VFSTGEVVDWMVAGGISQYAEFKPVRAGVLWTPEGFKPVPCNKSEIFQDTTMSMLEKRKLMKFMESCQTLVENAEFDPEQGFLEFMAAQEVPENLQNIILFGVLMVEGDIRDYTLGNALNALQQYIYSLGVYKENSAMLYPMYGTSDVSQGFCRLCAVDGGIYVINPELQPVSVASNEEHKVVLTAMGELKARTVVVNRSFADLDPAAQFVPECSVLRGVVLARGIAYQNEGPVFLSIPPNSIENPNAIYILQVTSDNMVVPEGYSLLYLYTFCSRYQEDLAALQNLVPNLGVEVVFFGSYLQETGSTSGSLLHVNAPALGFQFNKHFVRVT